MGRLFYAGRILLGLLLVLAGFITIQSGYKDHANSFKAFRSWFAGYGYFGTIWRDWVSPNDTSIMILVYLHACLMIISGALVIASSRIGGLLMALAMLIHIVTRDNPLLTNSDI